MEFLQLLGVILSSIPLAQGVLPDVAPPAPVVAALSVGVLTALGLIVATIVLVSFLAIRAIKKSQTPKDKA